MLGTTCCPPHPYAIPAVFPDLKSPDGRKSCGVQSLEIGLRSVAAFYRSAARQQTDATIPAMEKALFVLLAMWVSVANAIPAKKLIRPGKSIGSVALGTSRSAILRTMGKPSETMRYKDGLFEDQWNSPLKNPAGFHHYMTVVFKNDKAVQIKVTSPEYLTPQGYSTATALGVWKKTYRNAEEIARGYNVQPVAYVSVYLDAIQSGITFVRSECDGRGWRNTQSGDAIIIHVPGRAVIPQPKPKLRLRPGNKRYITFRTNSHSFESDNKRPRIALIRGRRAVCLEQSWLIVSD